PRRGGAHFPRLPAEAGGVRQEWRRSGGRRGSVRRGGKGGCILAGSGRRGAADHCHAHGQHGGLGGAQGRRMLKVGLTGGLASGKTFVGEVLASSGCLLIQADELGHEVLAPGGEAYDSVVREFGREILTDGGLIDRQRLAALVFASPGQLARLNALVHPSVVRREE